MEDDLDRLEAADPFDDELDDIDESVELAAQSAADIELRVHRAAAAEIGSVHGHKNLRFLQPHKLHDGPRSVKIAQAVVVLRHSDGSVKGMYLIYEEWGRRSKRVPFERERRVAFDIETTEGLAEYLGQAGVAVEIEQGEYLALPAADVFDNLNDAQRQTFAGVLGEIARSRRVSELLVNGQFTSEIVDNLAAAAQHAKYKAALTELADMVAGKMTKTKRGGGATSLTEHDYQKWFEEHTWVFGTEYLRRIDLRAVDPHATVDFILETADGFSDVLELKTPSAPVLVFDSSHKTWYWSTDVAKVIAQAAKYLNVIEQNANAIYRYEKVSLVRPRVRVVIGRSIDWTEEQHEAFRRLSATLHGIDLLTFDHVMLRAQQLVNCYEQPLEIPTVIPPAPLDGEL